MDNYSTYDKEMNYTMALCDYTGTSFDNHAVIGTRFVIVMIESGSGIALLDGCSIPYIAPCAFCINEKEHLIINESDHSKLRAIYFNPNIINSSLNCENIRNLPPDSSTTLLQDTYLTQPFTNRKSTYHGKFNLSTISIKKCNRILDEIHSLIINLIYNWPCRSRAYIFELLFFFNKLLEIDSYSNETYMEMIEDDFQSILLYVYHNYENKISVQDITERFHISKTTLAKMFQKNVGETFISYLNKLRVTMAATMLRDTMLPVSDIMTRVGFYDSVHFLRTFKKYTGYAPSVYRERYCWM